MRIPRKIRIYDRLEVFHLEAYFVVKDRAARNHKKKIKDFLGRRSGILFVSDFARYESYDISDEKQKDEFLTKLNSCFEIVEKKLGKRVGKKIKT